MRELHRAHPGATFFVGMGTRQWMIDTGISPSKVIELDWWQEHTLSKDGRDYKFAFTPCQHWFVPLRA